MFAADRFAAILAVMVFLVLGEILARKVDGRLAGWSWTAVLLFILGARAGHVVIHWPSFAEEPWRVLAVWQGGFLIPAGLALAAAYTAFVFRRRPGDALWAVVPSAAAIFAGIVVLQLTAGTPPRPLPEGSFAMLDGGTVTPATLAGRPVVINLWASWCPPCRREMPMMADVAAGNDDAIFLFVNQGEERDTVSAYLVREGISLGDVVLDGAGAFARHYEIPGLPATLFTGADGALRSVHLGEISREQLQAGIAALQEPLAE